MKLLKDPKALAAPRPPKPQMILAALRKAEDVCDYCGNAYRGDSASCPSCGAQRRPGAAR